VLVLLFSYEFTQKKQTQKKFVALFALLKVERNIGLVKILQMIRLMVFVYHPMIG